MSDGVYKLATVVLVALLAFDFIWVIRTGLQAAGH